MSSGEGVVAARVSTSHPASAAAALSCPAAGSARRWVPRTADIMPGSVAWGRRRGTLSSDGCCWAKLSASMPVATTETRIRPSISGSIAEPNLIMAFGSTSSLIRLAASSISNSVRS